MTKDDLLALIREENRQLTPQQKLRLTVLLSLPAMIAQVSSIAMQIIDAAMLGHLGTDEAATVGLVSTTIWLLGGLCSACASGFSIQIAHKIGANAPHEARNIIRQGMVACLIFSSCLMVLGLSVAPFLPHWLGADERICAGATEYLTIVCLALPILEMYFLAAGCLRCSGNVKIPSLFGVLMCTTNVVLNYIFIFVCGWGTTGAAVGSFCAYLVSMSGMMFVMTKRDRQLRFALDSKKDIVVRPQPRTLRRALTIGFPISLERGLMCGAQVAISGIIAPMGTVAITANTFGINIESLCYMPGYGIAEATTTLVGQSMGARREDLMRSFAWISMALGVAIMTVMGMAMWMFAPEMLSVITSDSDVISLGTEVLRIEAWAEPGFAAAIIAYSVFVGAGRTLVPSLMNLGSIWFVRLSLAILLAPAMGLRGVWIAMAVELSWRGLMFALKLKGRKWSKIL